MKIMISKIVEKLISKILLIVGRPLYFDWLQCDTKLYVPQSSVLFCSLVLGYRIPITTFLVEHFNFELSFPFRSFCLKFRELPLQLCNALSLHGTISLL